MRWPAAVGAAAVTAAIVLAVLPTVLSQQQVGDVQIYLYIGLSTSLMIKFVSCCIPLAYSGEIFYFLPLK